MDSNGRPPAADVRADAHSTVDLSGLFDLKTDASNDTPAPLIGESGLWPELDAAEKQSDRSLEVDLDTLSGANSKDAAGRLDEMPADSGQTQTYQSPEIAGFGIEDQFVRTVMDITGWIPDKITVTDERIFCPIFTDGVKDYEFVDWQIRVSFRRAPGLVILEWSPETLSEDVKRAASAAILADCNVEETARMLKERFSSQQLRQLSESLTENS
ncbi:MAG: hypothetical protein RDU20_12710 [Desulfomonilaceae bacterium]|nr:hypothetical protein [Desulfomonilaceae bacterium]